MSEAWAEISSAPEGKEVRIKIHDERGARNETTLIRKGALWFFPDMSMYVYYQPTHWRPLRGDGLLSEAGDFLREGTPE